ncbi:hypothetical protein Hanom_Chr10g00918041 [Helianthus anomalus]
MSKSLLFKVSLKANNPQKNSGNLTNHNKVIKIHKKKKSKLTQTNQTTYH